MHGLAGEAFTTAPGTVHRVQLPMQGDLVKGRVARFI